MVPGMSDFQDQDDDDTSHDAHLERLLMAAKDGDDKALNRFLTEMRKELRPRAHGKLPAEVRQREDTSDLVQDTLIECLEYLARFRGNTIEEWRASMQRILKNNTKDTLRSQLMALRRAVRSERSLDDPNQGLKVKPQLVTPDDSPSEQLARKEQTAQILAAIQKLPEQQRKAINLWLANYSFQEIAEELRVTETAAQSLVRHAKEALERMLTGAIGLVRHAKEVLGRKVRNTP